ncbi:hypothetical protein VP01_3647g2 [Puccinia sorghi]|uniref:Small ribosomal subunit protein mS41 n=1 Tax=Puccinia sorghi TaxID=27349 RepID=A0A0L6UUJ5_9BASI|nr:hypothetical protein VP01_3647g2 [Puccinia sorghi]
MSLRTYFRKLIHTGKPPRLPAQHHQITNVSSFLTAIKRPNLIQLDNWEELFLKPKEQPQIKQLIPKERRYLFRAIELFRHGLDPNLFAIPPKKPKKFRG